MYILGEAEILCWKNWIFVDIEKECYNNEEIFEKSVSPDGKYELTLQEVGEPNWPFGSASGRVVLKKDDQEISNVEFELHNDGGSISNRCWTVTWYDEYAEVTLSREEQSDEHVLLYYDGKTERWR